MTDHPAPSAPAAPAAHGHYRAHLRDAEFLLFEVFGRQDVLGRPPYSEIDADTARAMLREVRRLATEDLAASYAVTDRRPPAFDPDTGSVTVTPEFASSYRAYRAAEWWRLDVPPVLGGTPCPPSLRWAVQEMVLGANPAIHMYACGYSFAGVLHELGTPDQQRLAELMIERGWGSAMVLTEPDAGSDVGAGRTRAVRQADGTWHLEGVKRFITNGDHDLADNIVHLVLARPEGAGPGTKGLALFAVPKFHVDLATGELGARNGVVATHLEHKMGLRASATCELAFGADPAVPAVGTMVGDDPGGIAQMFRLIEDARMMVGTKAMSTLSTAALNAAEYARTRVQGADLTRNADKTSPRVPIVEHADVRRMLLDLKAQAEGLRALVYFAASVQDDVRLARAAGDSAAEVAAHARNDLLLPLVKGYGSERSYAQLATAVQVAGGSGYLQDHPFEQYLRDAKIDTLYEGTTGIQGMDLFFRKIVRDEGVALRDLLTEITAFAKAGGADDALVAERDALGRAVDDVSAVVSSMVGWLRASAQDPQQIHRTGENTTRLLMVLGDLVVAWLLLRSADVARAALEEYGTDDAEDDRRYYETKVATARWFARTVLPGVTAARTVVESTDGSLMDLAADAF